MRKNKLKIIIISDGTGETGTTISRAVMTQFPDADAYFTRYKNVRNVEQIQAIFNEATASHDLILYTIVAAPLREALYQMSRKTGIRTLDLLGPALTTFSNFLEQEPSSMPGLLHGVNDQYFERVQAMEFTLNHDDGRNLESLHLADVVLVGISRTSKTPLSVYLSQHGIKVVNIPLIKGSPLPEALFKIDQRKIMGLTIDPQALLKIRKKRLTRLGSGPNLGDYASDDKVLEELEWANDLFKENRRWVVFNVTNKALQETAAEIMKLLNSRNENIFMKDGPRP